MPNLNASRRALLCAGFGGVLLSNAIAGPSFNPDRDELAELSGKAGAELHLAFQKFHEALMHLELRDVKRASDARAAALKHFEISIATFKEVADKAPKQKLVYKPRNQSDQAALAAFNARLAERKIPAPSTERELATLAVKAISDHVGVLKETSFTATKADYIRLRDLLRSQAILLDLGILTSIVWTVSQRQ